MKIDPEGYLDYLQVAMPTLMGKLQPLYHPLGFVSCVIPYEDDSVKLRLHYWPANERRVKNPNWPIHTHNYRLSSLVLKGQIADTQYAVSDDGESYLYEVRYRGEDSTILGTGKRCSLHEITRNVWSSGQGYIVDKGVFHESSVALNQSAVTFVCLTNKGEESPLVIGDAAMGIFPYDRAVFSGDEFWGVVNESLTETIKSRSRKI